MIIALLCIIAYCIMARLVYAYARATAENQVDRDYDSPFIGAGWPIYFFYLVFLKYPFKLSDLVGNFIGNRQLEISNKRLEKRLAIRHELEEAQRQLRIELEKDPLTEQFEELEREEKRRAHIRGC